MLSSPILPCPSLDDAPAGACGPACVSGFLRVHNEDSQGRQQVEAFIANVYAQRFAARVTSFAPTLVSLCDERGIVSAAGYRIATEPLYLERYLSAPIEVMLAERAGARPARESIVEIGHLAVRRPNEGRRLFPLLARHLAERRLRWGVSTLTVELRHLLTRMGIHSFALGPADPVCLGAAASDWGDYYLHRPVVVAGQLSVALAQMTARGSR